ncbi:MAG: helix-turn-helix transcriptional regulator [Clostridia bacterium]|nr:helix-turn-helix transcriptional regulator [Clostridia bacterium]
MYVNLMAQKQSRRLSDEDMARIIGVTPGTYRQKLKSGRFYPDECRKYCEYFNQSFKFLFATDEEA